MGMTVTAGRATRTVIVILDLFSRTASPLTLSLPLCKKGGVYYHTMPRNGDVPPKDAPPKGCAQDPSNCPIPAGCGNGTLDSGEECDDGNNVSGDGCSMTCRQETGFVCPTPGSPCTSTVAT